MSVTIIFLLFTCVIVIYTFYTYKHDTRVRFGDNLARLIILVISYILRQTNNTVAGRFTTLIFGIFCIVVLLGDLLFYFMPNLRKVAKLSEYNKKSFMKDVILYSLLFFMYISLTLI
jgi:hypothetical protein